MPFYLRQIDPVSVGRKCPRGLGGKEDLVASQEEAANRFEITLNCDKSKPVFFLTHLFFGITKP
jgi:hypothetical protein